MLDNNIVLFAGYTKGRTKPVLAVHRILGDDISEVVAVFGSERQRRRFVALMEQGLPMFFGTEGGPS